MSGSIRTIADILDQRPQQQTDTGTQRATVIGIDYIAKQLSVNVNGRSGPRRVRVAQSVDLGTNTNRKVTTGMQVMIQRLDDEYICVAALP